MQRYSLVLFCDGGGEIHSHSEKKKPSKPKEHKK